jgi:hypothetical protein
MLTSLCRLRLSRDRNFHHLCPPPLVFQEEVIPGSCKSFAHFFRRSKFGLACPDVNEKKERERMILTRDSRRSSTWPPYPLFPRRRKRRPRYRPMPSAVDQRGVVDGELTRNDGEEGSFLFLPTTTGISQWKKIALAKAGASDSSSRQSIAKDIRDKVL